VNRRNLLLSGLGLLAPASALAQRRGVVEELPLPPPPAPHLPGLPRQALVLGDLAPMPNRDIQAPPDIFGTPVGPRLEPMIIDDREQRRGFTFGREHLSDRQDVLLRDLAPGARLRIPLE